MSLGKIFSSTQKLGPWGLLQKAKNPNFEGPFRGPEGHENIFFGIHGFQGPKRMSLGKIFGSTKKLGPWGLLQKANNPNFEGPFRGPEGHENFYFLGA